MAREFILIIAFLSKARSIESRLCVYASTRHLSAVGASLIAVFRRPLAWKALMPGRSNIAACHVDRRGYSLRRRG